MRILALFLLLLFFTARQAQAHREEVYYLQGSIGAREVGLQLDESGDECLARYFTFDTRRDRFFEGKILGGGWFELFAYSWSTEITPYEQRERLVLREVETDVWEGTLQKPGGAEEKVKLWRIDIDELDHPYARAVKRFNVSPYVALKTRDVSFRTGKTKRIGRGVEIQKLSDPRSGLEWFRIAVHNPGFGQVDSINDLLTAEQLSFVGLKYSIPAALDTSVFSVRYEVEFLNSRVLSYIVDFCGLSFFGTERKERTVKNLSLATARQLMLEDLFWLGNEPQPILEEGEYRWTQYRYKEFGPKIYALLEALYPRRFAANEAGKCRYNDPRIWYFPEWYLQKKGLMLISKSPLSNNGCKEVPTCVIPFGKLSECTVDGYEF